MKRCCLSLILLGTIQLTVSAQKSDGKLSRDLATLREEHQIRVNEALEPITRRYIHDLETLLKRANFDNDLETALKVRQELNRIRPDSETAFVGQWEYKQNGNTYRRIIYSNGKVGIWKNGKLWVRENGDPIWVGFTWKLQGEKLKIIDPSGNDFAEWAREGPDTILQKQVNAKDRVKMYRAKEPWKE